MSRPVMKFEVDADTLKEIEKLQDAFGASDPVEVIRKALALAAVAKANTDSTGVLTIIAPDNEQKRRYRLNE